MLHRVAAKAVKTFDRNLIMAGIGSGNARSAVYHAFLDDIKKHPENIDIVDYHQYQSTPKMHQVIVQELRQKLDTYNLQRVKIGVTEWGIASSGKPYHRQGMQAATYNASVIKALSQSGVAIGGFFSVRDYPRENWKWGMISEDGSIKPAYWGQWLWAQLPDTHARLDVQGGNERIQSFAYANQGGVDILIWYDAPLNSPLRDISFFLPNEKWAGYVLKQWQLDATRHIGYIPEGSPVSLPHAVSSEKYKQPRHPYLSFKMMPQSMRLMKIRPLGQDEIPPAARPTLLDNPAYFSTPLP